jgi:hypothetical protein
MRKLSRKQQLFVEAYCGQAAGNATEAARIAGYSGTVKALTVISTRNLAKSSIIEAIAAYDKTHPKVASAEKIRQFWTDVMTDTSVDMGDRLQASQLLAKASAMFIKRQEHKLISGGLTDKTIDTIKRFVLGIEDGTEGLSPE